MRRWAVLACVLAVAGCNQFRPTPTVVIPRGCEDFVNADPAVRNIRMKQAGSGYLLLETDNTLRYAEIDAAHRCAQMRGIAPRGGGVERQRDSN